MSETPSNPARRPRRLLAFAISLVVAELLLRGFFVLRVVLGVPSGCGVHPEILGRLFYAYGGGRYSMLSVDSDMTTHDPHRGYKNKPNLRERPVSGEPVSTNSRGFRGVREFALPKPPGVVRIVALGDSLTFGEGVKDDETWPAQLEGALPGTEVANLGERAYAHDQMYYALSDDGLPIDPDLVIVGFYPNDVWRDVLTYYCYEKPRFSLGASGWQIENVPVPTPTEVRNHYLLLPLVYAVPEAVVDAFTEPSMSVEGGDDRAGEIFRRMRAATEQHGARFVVVNMPEHLDNPPDNHGFFHDYCATSGAECVDAWPLFRAMADTEDPNELRKRYLRPNDIHYSRAGYAVVVEALRRHFAERPLTHATSASTHP
jgi:lysophospholipase L1-like esterase